MSLLHPATQVAVARAAWCSKLVAAHLPRAQRLPRLGQHGTDDQTRPTTRPTFVRCAIQPVSFCSINRANRHRFRSFFDSCMPTFPGVLSTSGRQLPYVRRRGRTWQDVGDLCPCFSDQSMGRGIGASWDNKYIRLLYIYICIHTHRITYIYMHVHIA